MSDAPRQDVNPECINLLPPEIRLDPYFAVRPYSQENTDDEDKRVEKLAASLEELGQTDALLITEDHRLIAGHRRRRAAILINEARTRVGKPLFRLRCSIDLSGGDLRRKAIHSNLHRRENSAMDMAYLCTCLRNEHDWRGWPGTKRLSDYLGVDAATINQYEKLMGVERQVQNRVHLGQLSVQSALDLLKVPQGQRLSALARAQEIQEEEDLDRTLARYRNGKQSIAKTTELIQEPTRHVARPAVIKAIRERHIVTTQKISLSRSELVRSIGQFDANGFTQEQRDFARYFASEYAPGLGSPEELRRRFERIGVARAPSRQEPLKSDFLAN